MEVELTSRDPPYQGSTADSMTGGADYDEYVDVYGGMGAQIDDLDSFFQDLYNQQDRFDESGGWAAALSSWLSDGDRPYDEQYDRLYDELEVYEQYDEWRGHYGDTLPWPYAEYEAGSGSESESESDSGPESDAESDSEQHHGEEMEEEEEEDLRIPLAMISFEDGSILKDMIAMHGEGEVGLHYHTDQVRPVCVAIQYVPLGR